MSMSRSLVGSSSSSTLGSAIRSRVSCSRRRSPPERCPTGVHCRAAGNPSRSNTDDAVSSSLPSRTYFATSSVASSTRISPGRSTSSCDSSAICTVLPRTTRPPSSGRSPVSACSRVVLPEPLTPTMADPVAGPEPPGDVVEQRAPADRARWRPPAQARCGRAGWWRTRAAPPCRGAAARRRSAPRRPRCGTAAWTCARAARAAARPAPCGRGSDDGPRRRRPAARARRGRRPSRCSRPRSSRPGRPPPPTCGCRRCRGTTGRA